MTAPVLSLHNLDFSWPHSQPLFHIHDLQIQAGDTLFISGPSGCGKSTLLNIITGLLPPTQGDVQLSGQSLYTLNSAARDRLRGRSMGVIAQTLNLLPYLTVSENLQLMQHFAGQKPDRQWQQQLLAGLNLSEQAQQTVSQLSLGQQQRAAIARALIHRPPLIVADEPTSALDDDNKDAFMELLLSEITGCNSALLMVSHDKRLTPYFKRELDMRSVSAEALSC